MHKALQSFDAWTKPGKEMFEFWVSFWPVAPAFGVEWRFADAMPRFTPRILELDEARADEATKPAAKEKAPRKKPASRKAAVKQAVEAVAAPVEAAAEVTAATTEAIVEAGIAAAEEVATGTVPPAGDGLPARPAALFDTAPEQVDDLKLIKGIGPGLEKQLNGLGVYTFKQIAGFSDDDLAWIDDNLTTFKGRCFRDDWVGQAKAQLG